MSEAECDPLSGKREKLVLRLMPHIHRHGFSLLKMEDAAKIMDISKATMYKYFASKDEIVECMIEKYVRYIADEMLLEAPQKLSAEALTHPSAEELKVYNDSFAKAFKLANKLTVYLTDALLQDLSAGYPGLLAKLNEAQEQCQRKLVAYFESGIELGVFYPFNSRLLLVQMDLVIRKLLDPNWLMMQNMTLKQALLDFYKAIKHQCFYEKWVSEDDTEIGAYFDRLIAAMGRL